MAIRSNPLGDPSNVVLTEETALQLFGEPNPTGKTLEISIEDTYHSFEVTAIVENIPTNSSNSFQVLGSFDFWLTTERAKSSEGNWNRSFLPVYVLLREGSRLASNKEALLKLRRTLYPNEESNLRESGMFNGEGAPSTYRLQPLGDMHIDTKVSWGAVPPINPQNIWILVGIAFAVLLIAIINFTTLSIGKSASRAREVGVRKVVGSNRQQLITQFVTESMIISVISVVIAMGLIQILLPYFNDLAGREVNLSLIEFPQYTIILAGITILTGLLAGIYPAFVLSGFKPVSVLKNKIKLGGSNLFTKGLVTTQFVISIGLVISTLIILGQLQYMRSKDPGFNKEHVIVIDADDSDTRQTYPILKSELINHPGIQGIAASELGLGAGTGWSRSGFDYKGELKTVYEYYVDDDYLEVMDIEVLNGRSFDANREDGPNRSVIVNEAMVEDFGWTIDNAVGQMLTGYFEDGNDPTVIGVVRNFHFRSFHEDVKPQMFHQYDDYAPFRFFVRLAPGDPTPVLKDIASVWHQIEPGIPFHYTFLDEDIDRFYRSESRLGKIIGWAGGISIFLACLGLLGLASLAVINRRKEIGIRRILGANLMNVVGLLSADFIKLVVIAIILASPLVWYVMTHWLESFAYATTIKWWIFMITGIGAIALTILTISFQGLRSGVTNPVDNLRSE